MHQLSNQQIDFIFNDIRARGIEMESLQHDLLDHICCIIENHPEATRDFDSCYATVIKTFYKKELREIEEETISLLTNKHYYAMKKIMIVSGILSAALLTMGIALKFLHMHGASFGIVAGIVLFSFIFLPLMFTLKVKEKQQTKDKVLLGLGSLVGILISLAIMFKIMHWPYANVMGITSVGILILLYLPVNLVTGIRNPDTKVNTIVSSILLIAGCGLFLSLARSPQGSKEAFIKTTAYFVRNNQLVQKELDLFQRSGSTTKNASALTNMSMQIISECESIKSYLLEKETGLKSIGPDFESKEAWLGETYTELYFANGSKEESKLFELRKMVKEYNDTGSHIPGFQPFSESKIFATSGNERIYDALNNLVQLELYVLQNEKMPVQ